MKVIDYLENIDVDGDAVNCVRICCGSVISHRDFWQAVVKTVMKLRFRQ
jgi:hypothetical protein